MNKLCVLYDSSCGFCTRCRWWLAMQPQYIPLEFMAAGSPEAARRFPAVHEREELVVIDDEGGIYRGPDAFIMCLYALEEYRELSIDLSSPLLKPFARAAFEMLSTGRHFISKIMMLESEDQVRETLGESPG